MTEESGRTASNPRKGRAARKFFRMDFAYRKAPGIHLENKAALLQGRWVLGPPPGQRGFPDYSEPPRFVFDKKLGPWPRDMEIYHSYWLISDRMKTVLEEVDPEGFAFVRCDVRLPDGTIGPVYWLCDVVRVLDAVDEAASRVKIADDHGRKIYLPVVSTSFIFKDEVVGAAHVFRLTYLEPAVFCDQDLKNACKKAGLKGVRLEDATDL